MLKTLEKYVLCQGVSGNENAISNLIKDDITPFVDEIYNDKLGNLIAVIKSKDKNNNKKLMFSAHMDVNGLVVTFIEDNGYLRVSNLGGVDLYSVIYSVCSFSNGTKGIIVTNEESYKDLKARHLYIDIGAKNKKEAEEAVSVGDIAFIDSYFTVLKNDRVCARGLDNRAGCFALSEAIKSVKNNIYDLYFVFSVQEELGLRGAKAAAGAILPDFGIAVDVTDTGDMQDDNKMEIKLGNGAAIKILDRSCICSPIINKNLKRICDEESIKYQYEVLECGGTDTAAMQLSGSGAMVSAISVPTRFVHTGVEEIDLSDLSECIKLITKICNTTLE